MATRIVGMLNARYGHHVLLPASATHDHANGSALADAIIRQLSGTSADAQSGSSAPFAKIAGSRSEGDDVVIIGQASCLPGNVNDVEAF